jgi:hypothetical protein
MLPNLLSGSLKGLLKHGEIKRDFRAATCEDKEGHRTLDIVVQSELDHDIWCFKGWANLSISPKNQAYFSPPLFIWADSDVDKKNFPHGASKKSSCELFSPTAQGRG